MVQLSGKAVLVENNRDHDLAVGRQHPLNAVPQLKAAVVALVEVFLEYDYHSTAPVDGVLDVLQDWIPGRKVPVVPAHLVSKLLQQLIEIVVHTVVVFVRRGQEDIVVTVCCKCGIQKYIVSGRPM